MASGSRLIIYELPSFVTNCSNSLALPRLIPIEELLCLRLHLMNWTLSIFLFQTIHVLYLYLLFNRYSYSTSHTRFISNADFFSPCVSNQYPVTHYKYILTFLTLSLVQDHSPKSPLACANFGPCGL